MSHIMHCRSLNMIGLALILLTASPIRGADKPRIPFTVKVSFTTSYDDNILRYSGYDLLRFETNTEPYPAEITTSDDWVNTLGLRLYRDIDLGSRFKLRGYYSGKINLYAVNQIKNYQSHYFSARLGYRSRAYLILKYSYLPSYYLRIYRDRDWSIFHGAQFDLSRPAISLRWRFPFVEIEGELGREFVYYNGYFTEYDSRAFYGGLSVSRRFMENLDVSLGYTFTSSDNIGFNYSTNLAAQDPLTDTEYGDATYEEDEYTLSLSYLLPLESNWDWRIALGYRHSERFYQSQLPLAQDGFHTGREDRRNTFTPSLTISPLSTLDLELTFSYDQRRSDSPNASVPKIKNYDERSFEIGIVYQIF